MCRTTVFISKRFIYGTDRVSKFRTLKIPKIIYIFFLPDYLGKFIKIFFSFVDPTDGEFRTISENEISNNFRIDSVEVTGDCCFEIESNSGDYEIVDPENPRDISIFYIHKIYVYNSC